ncbi:MAG: cysteine synthase A [Methanomassiliicoccales archaeon]|nr:cysteine synthase A [Methanomassiliicoccales archaeon]
MKVVSSILELRGNTPMIKLNRVVPPSFANIYAKLEYFSPTGSVKDRIAAYMIEEAEKRGELKPGYRIVEATTGNTGIAFALAGAMKGYRVTIVMPEGMSDERKKILRALGAEIIYTPGSETDVDKCIKKVREIQESDSRVWVPSQFTSMDNVLAHETTTGPECVEQIGRNIDAFVAGVGSGGTLMGVARYFKKVGINANIVAVEPEECSVIKKGNKGPHRIEGIGDGFIPEIVDTKLITRVELVSDTEAIEMARRLAREEGILCGISAGANVAASIRIAEELGVGKNVVTIIPDTGMRYFSTDLFKDV